MSSPLELRLAKIAPARAVVNLAALRHNGRVLKQAAEDLGAKMMAVVKADAYGHGVVQASSAFIEAGINAFAVATLAEGVELREGLRKLGYNDEIVILIFGAPTPADVEFLIEYALDTHVTSVPVARAIVNELNSGRHSQQIQLRTHICVETGMMRVGCRPEEATEVWKTLKEC